MGGGGVSFSRPRYNLAFAGRCIVIARDYYSRAVLDLHAALRWREEGDTTMAELRLRTGRHAAVCAAGSLELAMLHSRAP